ncbi:hypothetical protein GCM10029964_000630 [Kibdelosporangium lantanae]
MRQVVAGVHDQVGFELVQLGYPALLGALAREHVDVRDVQDPQRPGAFRSTGRVAWRSVHRRRSIPAAYAIPAVPSAVVANAIRPNVLTLRGYGGISERGQPPPR